MFILAMRIESFLSNVILVILSMCVHGGGRGEGVAHGCFLWENGRSGVEGQCLGGLTVGASKVRSDSGQMLLDKFLYSCHLLQDSKTDIKS